MELNIEKLRYNSVKKRIFTTNVSGKESVDGNAKVLCVNASASCGRSEILNNEIIIEGVVKYTAVIKIDDEIKNIERSERFTINEALLITPESSIVTNPSVDKVKGYVEAGKIMFSSEVNVLGIIFSPKETSFFNDIEDFRKKEKSIKCFDVNFIKNLRFGINENTELSPRLPEIKSILSTNGSVMVKEAHISAGQLIIGGDISIQTVFNSLDEYEPVVQVFDKFDFSQIIDINDTDAKNPYVILNVEDIITNLKPNEQGEIRCIEYNVGLYGYTLAGTTIARDVISDAYSLKNKAECIFDEINYSYVDDEINTLLSKSIRVKLPENVSPVARICSVNFFPEIIESKVIDSKAILQCFCDVSVIYTASGTGEIAGVNTTASFDIVFENVILNGAEDVFAYVSLTDMQAVLVSGTEIEIRAGLNVKTIPQCNVNERIVTDIKISETNDFPEFGIIIYNVQRNDSLWDICKKYGVDEEDVIKLNPEISEKLSVGDKVYLFRKLEV